MFNFKHIANNQLRCEQNLSYNLPPVDENIFILSLYLGNHFLPAGSWDLFKGRQAGLFVFVTYALCELYLVEMLYNIFLSHRQLHQVKVFLKILLAVGQNRELSKKTSVDGEVAT